VPNAQVKVEMKKHAFLFGTAVAMDKWRGGGSVSDKDRDRYREIILNHFNMIETENSLKWRGMTEWGTPLEMTLEQLRWARQHGLYTRGHVLVWPSWEHTPDAVQARVKNNPDELRKVVRNHVTDLVTKTKGLVDDWDVTNETAGNRDYMDILGPEEMVQWYKLARAADPKVKLTFNEPNFGNEGMEGGSFPSKKLPQYKGWVDYLIKNKAPLDRLGSQEHGGTSAKIGKKKDPAEAWKFWDRIYKDYGKELLFSELDVSIENDQDEEQLKYQADMLRDSIILAFAHPSFVGLNQWGFWENAHWYPKAALWRKDWTIKPNGEAYLDLVYNKWWTKASSKANAQGEYSTRGFKGDYEIEVIAGGKTIKVPAKIGDKANVVTVKLP
jgi:GH35 family endo-1,4-beta-xylanase